METIGLSDGGTPGPDPSIGLTLRLLADCVPGGLVLLLGARDVGVQVTAACPASIRAGSDIAVPPGLLTAQPVAFDATTRRIPTVWTALLSAMPAHFAAAPVGERALHLVVAGTGAASMAPRALARWAQLIDRLLDGGRAAVPPDASRRLAALIDGLPSPLAFVDGDTIRVFVNDGARQLLDIAPGVRSARAVAAALARLVADDGGGQAAILARDPMASLTFAIDRAGRHFAVDSRWVREPYLNGRVWLFRDVTDDYRIARFRDELVSNVSHELRTPLTSILGALTLLNERLNDGADGGMSAQHATLIDIALRNGRRLLYLVGDLLDLDRAEAHGLEVTPARTDLSLLLADAIMQNRPMALRHGVTVVLHVVDEDHGATVDPDRLLQVVGNLLSNAVKFSPEGAEVSVRLARTTTGWRITVADRGAGVPDDLREQLFTRFARGSVQSRIGVVGTGLGLAISKAIVEAHRGTISVDPAGEGGAVFHVDLPDADHARDSAR